MSTERALPQVWVSLTIVGSSFDPKYVTRELDVEPTYSIALAIQWWARRVDGARTGGESL
jgi:hypothetical protein